MQAYPFPERVPLSATRRLLRNVADLLTAVDVAVASAEPLDPAAGRLGRAAALLHGEQSTLLAEVEAFQDDDREPLLRRAADLRLLARRMDGYFTSGAPEDQLATCRKQQQLLVLTAWQITAAASGSEAAGL